MLELSLFLGLLLIEEQLSVVISSGKLLELHEEVAQMGAKLIEVLPQVEKAYNKGSDLYPTQLLVMLTKETHGVRLANDFANKSTTYSRMNLLLSIAGSDTWPVVQSGTVTLPSSTIINI